MGSRKLEYSDLKNLCRLCLTPGRNIGIFEEEGQQRQIGYKIRSCMSHVIYPGDPLPQSICPECLVKLENTHEFQQKCLKNIRILTTVLMEEVTGHAPEALEYIKLLDYSVYTLEPINEGCLEAQDDDIAWQLAGPLIGLEAQEEMLQIFVQDGPSNPFLPEPDDLTLMNEADVDQNNSFETRNNEDNAPQSPETGTAVENTATNASQPTADCSDSTLEDMLSRIKLEPEEVDEAHQADEQEIVMTWLTPSAYQEEDVLDISKVKTEPVPVSLAVIKQEQSEPAAVPVMATNNAEVKEEPSTSSAQSQTSTRRINVECSKCSLVFHREVQILRHRCIGVSPWYCEPCNKYYKTKETFSRHKRFSCQSEELKCIACDNVFPNKIQLARHQVIHLKVKITKVEVTKLNTCKTCLRTFSSKASLNMHERSHLSVNMRDRYLRGTESKFPHSGATPQSTETHSELLQSSIRNVPAQQSASVSGKPKNQYHCTVCKAVFTNQKLFNAHNRQHGLKNPYRPKKQPMTFETDRNKGQQERLQPATLKFEVADNHSSTDRHTCIICRKSFDTQEVLIEHKKLHTTPRSVVNTSPIPSFTTGNGTLPVSEWVCKICGLDCRQSKVLWSHMHEQHSRISYKCSHCQKTFGKLCSLKSHEKIHEPKLNCTACGKQYSTLKALAAHEQSKHMSPSATHLCRKCNIKFDSRSALLIHARGHQNLPKGKKNISEPSTSDNLHTCFVCSKVFIRYDSLKRHENTHAVGKHTYYPCQICGLKFIAVSNYKAHTEKHFQNMAKTRCSTCHKTFFTQDFHKHSCVKWQRGPSTSQANTVKTFECELCTAVFGTQQARNSHMRIHRKNWKYPTQRMQNSIAFKKAIQRSGNISRTIYCPLCSKAFLSKGELQRHIRVLHPKK